MKKEKDTLPYFVNGVRYQIINGQRVKIEPKREGTYARYFRHLNPIRKAQGLICEEVKSPRTGKVSDPNSESVQLDDRHIQGDLFKWN